MFSRSTWRAVTRISLVRENYEAIRTLNTSFYLLLALYRARCFREADQLQKLYFHMIESFAQYGRVQAKDTLDQLLRIPWFADRKRLVYELITIYRRVIDRLPAINRADSLSVDRQKELNLQIKFFIEKFKELNEFGPQDEARVAVLSKDPELMREMVAGLFESLNAPGDNETRTG